MIIAASVGVALVAGSTMLAAPGQGTRTPGQPTEGRVWIENRGRNEAIPIAAADPLPVVVQNVATASLPVRLAGASPNMPPAPVAVQSVQQAWEYRTIAVPGNADAQAVTRLLAGEGVAGFELAGQLPATSGTLLVLKRPR
jgi:hypothetical protein